MLGSEDSSITITKPNYRVAVLTRIEKQTAAKMELLLVFGNSTIRGLDLRRHTGPGPQCTLSFELTSRAGQDSSRMNAIASRIPQPAPHTKPKKDSRC